MKKQLAAAAMASLMVFSLAGCSAKEEAPAEETTAAAETEAAAEEKTEEAAETEAAAEGKTLIMGTNAEFPPYEYYEDGVIVGIDVDIAKAITEKMGMGLEVEDMAFDAIIPAVTSGKVDFGAAGMTVTDKRKQSVDFTITYANSNQVIIVPEDSEIKGAKDLEGKIIGVQLGTIGDALATENVADATVERYGKGMEAVQSMKQNKVDAVIIDQSPAEAFCKKTEGIKILDEKMSEAEEYAIAMKKGNTELLEGMNKAIEELQADGTIDAIVAKYLDAE